MRLLHELCYQTRYKVFRCKQEMVENGSEYFLYQPGEENISIDELCCSPKVILLNRNCVYWRFSNNNNTRLFENSSRK